MTFFSNYGAGWGPGLDKGRNLTLGREGVEEGNSPTP